MYVEKLLSVDIVRVNSLVFDCLNFFEKLHVWLGKAIDYRDGSRSKQAQDARKQEHGKVTKKAHSPQKGQNGTASKRNRV
jgi:hypothetical protein